MLAFAEGWGDQLVERGIHVERHEMEADIYLADAHRAKGEGRALVLREGRGGLSVNCVDGGRVVLDDTAFGVGRKNGFERVEDRGEIGHRGKSPLELSRLRGSQAKSEG